MKIELKPSMILVKLVALFTLGSGLINFISLIGPSLPERHAILKEFFALEFIHLSKFLTMAIGMALVVSAINIYRRKKRAFLTVLILSIFSIIFHLTKGLDYEEASVSLVLLLVLILARKSFVVKSSIPDIRWGLARFGIAVLLAFGYGIAAFWFLDKNHFEINFHIGEAIKETFLYLTWIGDSTLIPRTRYAKWFLDSLYFLSSITIIYSLYALFRPVIYRFRTLPNEISQTRTIVEQYGRSSMDYFKFWPDKSYYFSKSQKSVVAYGVANNFAIALGDPVGPEDEIEEIIRGFSTYCQENDWGTCFHQTLPDYLPIFEKLGFRKIKIGDDGIVDLKQFTLEKAKKEIRHTVRKMEEAGIHSHFYQPPVPDEIIARVKEVSDEWLQISGRRERHFTLGMFETEYIRSTPVLTAEDIDGKIQGFVNLIPSYLKGEVTNDLMRRRKSSPNGIMDYLFIKLFLHSKEQGYERFNLGMAPMSGFRENEQASPEEKAIHYFFQHLNFLFSYKGLLNYKAKFANTWEPRYSIYRGYLDLTRLAIALRELSEVKKPIGVPLILRIVKKNRN